MWICCHGWWGPRRVPRFMYMTKNWIWHRLVKTKAESLVRWKCAQSESAPHCGRRTAQGVRVKNVQISGVLPIGFLRAWLTILLTKCELCQLYLSSRSFPIIPIHQSLCYNRMYEMQFTYINLQWVSGEGMLLQVGHTRGLSTHGSWFRVLEFCKAGLQGAGSLGVWFSYLYLLVGGLGLRECIRPQGVAWVLVSGGG